ncbi:putative F-box associated interaction domain, F-box-like domain superfamily [Helianthus debilis subsp. tardiflorus]
MEEPHSPHNNITPELPIDIINSEILPRLPAKSAVRFKCVCKQWLSFLSTQEFATMRYCRAAASRKLLYVDKRSPSIRTIDCESPNHGSATINHIPCEARPSDVVVLASLDGLVCLCLKKTCELVIWNPLTRAYKKLPNSKSRGFFKVDYDTVGFYVDSSYDYKILHIKLRRGTIGACIYSRRVDTWRNIKFLKKRQRINNYKWSSGIFSGDSLYFTVEEWCRGGETMVIGFDVNSEKFKEIKYPEVPRVDGDSFYANLVDVENRLHMFVSYGFLDWTIDLWRMEEEKWVKVAGFTGIENMQFSMTPIYVMRNGKWIVTCDWSTNVYEVDIKEKEYICIDTKTNDYMCVHPGSWFHGIRVTYIESTLSPNL